MNNSENAITPIDGRYSKQTQFLNNYFSEIALVKYRIAIEIEYLVKLSCYKIISLSKKESSLINKIINEFDSEEFKKVKIIEEKINHDVKSIEYYLRTELKEKKLERLIPFIHFGLTSEDINNLSYALMLNDFKKEVLAPQLLNLLNQLEKLMQSTTNIPILARTHGQPAVGTTFGKEIANYYHRLEKQYDKIKQFIFEGKCNGAVGNFNAVNFTYPNIDWIDFSNSFIDGMGLKPNLYTTQILPYDNWLEFFQIIMLANGILFDMSINFWQYIMLNIIQQKKGVNNIGSSTMPQKINPIDFENAEGNLQIANSQFEFYVRKLVSSRLQHDLSDSTVRRNFGTTFSHTILAWNSILRGLNKISINKKIVQTELNNHWEILAEAVQTYLRSTNNKTAYEKLRVLTQGKTLTKNLYFNILKRLNLDKVKILKTLTPTKYVGLAEKLTKLIINSKLIL